MGVGLNVFKLVHFLLILGCSSKSIDRILYDAQPEKGLSSWNDYKIPGSKDDRQLVKLQLDMILPLEEAEQIYPNIWFGGRRLKARRYKRSAVRDESKLWPRRVPYEISEGFDQTQRQKILEAIQHWTEFTCLDFVERSSRDTSYIAFVYDRFGEFGCASYVGKQPNPQSVILAPNCVYTDIIIHEIGHAIGLYHEHTRPDRDQYVIIHRDNIEDGMWSQFKKGSWSKMNSYSKPYDYYSIMHYSKDFFSRDLKSGLLTIEPRNRAYLDEIGTGRALSFLDAKLVNSMYSCSVHCIQQVCPEYGFLGKHCECYCPSKDRNIPYQPCALDFYDLAGHHDYMDYGHHFSTETYEITISAERQAWSPIFVEIHGEVSNTDDVAFGERGIPKGVSISTVGPIRSVGNIQSVIISLGIGMLEMHYIHITAINSGDEYVGYLDTPIYYQADIQLSKLFKPGCRGNTFTPGRGAYRTNRKSLTGERIIRDIKTASKCRASCRRRSGCTTVFFVERKQNSRSRCHISGNKITSFVFTEYNGQGQMFLRKCV